MDAALHTIIDSSRVLLADMNLAQPVRKLASVVVHGAVLIDQHRLNHSFALPQFERALFHLCHAVDRPLCGQCICRERELGEACKCAAVSHPH